MELFRAPAGFGASHGSMNGGFGFDSFLWCYFESEPGSMKGGQAY